MYIFLTYKGSFVKRINYPSNTQKTEKKKNKCSPKVGCKLANDSISKFCGVCFWPNTGILYGANKQLVYCCGALETLSGVKESKHPVYNVLIGRDICPVPSNSN